LKFFFSVEAGKESPSKNIKKVREGYISPYCRSALEPPKFMKFGIRGQLTDVITCVKFLVDRFRSYGVVTPPKLPFPIDLLRRPYNSSHYRATLWFGLYNSLYYRTSRETV